MKIRHALFAVLSTCAVANVAASEFEVTIRNTSPSGGVLFTPVWVGFHDGSFDTYDLGATTSASLELLAELGDTSMVSADFAASSSGIDATIAGPGPGPFAPGGSASMTFDLMDDGSNRFFSYASMVLPSSDYFVANGDPMAIDLSDLLSGVTDSITIIIGAPGDVTDAGTEVNDFTTAPASDAFGLPSGDPTASDNDDGAASRAVIGDPYIDFRNLPGDLSLLEPLNFNNASLYTNGIGSITISALRPLPAPTTLVLMSLGGLLIAAMGRVKHRKRSI